MIRRSVIEPESVYPLNGVDPSLPHHNLTILSEISANARIVALGEPTHGQKEINQLRDRITRYLIEHHGFRVVAMEDSAIKCRIVNDFVLHGKGSALEALSTQNFWAWRTLEVLAMIEWLRKWNTENDKAPVRFMGVDIQDFKTPGTELLRILPLVKLNLPTEVKTRLQAMSTISMWGDDPFEEEQFRSDMRILTDIRDAIQYFETTDELAFNLAQDCVFSLEQSLRLWREIKLSPAEGNAARWNRREEVMAKRTLAPTLNGEKVILWAQNGHVQSEKPPGLPEGSVTLGEHLRYELQEEYLVISGVFGCGSYRARNPDDGSFGTIDVGNPPHPSLDYNLWNSLDSDALIVDLDTPGSPLLEPQPTHWAGAALAPRDEMLTMVRPAIGSDAIAFVRTATPSEPI